MNAYSILKWVFHQGWLTRHRWVHDRLMRGFRHYADRDVPDAQELYGFLLLHRGVDDASRAAGARYLLACVDDTRPRVAWQLYRSYEDGQTPGLSKDVDKARYYLDMAARAGHPLAEERLASAA